MLPLEMLPLPRTGILKSKLEIDLIISISSSTIPSISIFPSLAIVLINLSKLSMLLIIARLAKGLTNLIAGLISYSSYYTLITKDNIRSSTINLF